ncbi:MAG: hypothetical protein RI894_898 [Bacteroidota bacterium]|jgi:outer membrane protein OmpA-like peptidoglycan-associated protein
MSKLLLTALGLCFFAAMLYAQPTKPPKPRAAAEYQKDEAKARKNLTDKDDAYKLIGQWQLAQLYADANAPQHNIDSAWLYVNEIDGRFTKIKMEVKEKAFKKAALDAPKLRKLKEAVVKAMFAEAREKGDIETLQNVLTATGKVKEYSLKKSRDSVRTLFSVAVMRIADTLQTIESITAFKGQFPVFLKENTSQNEVLDRKVFRLYFAKNGYANGGEFCKKYPQIIACKDTAYANFIRTMQARNEKGYQSFLERHAASSIFSEIATDSLAVTAMESAVKTGTLADCARLAAKFPNSHYIGLLDDKISDLFLKLPQLHPFYESDSRLDLSKLPKTAKAIYPVFANDGRTDRFVWFERAFKNYPDTAALRKDKAVAKMLEATTIANERILYTPEMATQYAAYIKAAAPKWLAFVALQKMIRADIDAKKWADAAATVRIYQPYFGKENPEILNLLELIETVKESDVTIVDIGESINTKEKDEIIPVLTIDNRQLFFCRHFLGEEDIYGSSKNDKGKWNFAYALAGLSEAGVHEAPLSISADGTSLVIFREGVLNETHKTIGGWSAPKNISENINSALWQGAASLSPNGRVLIYESQRKEVLGYNSHVMGAADYQNIDLFLSFHDSIGNWTKGVNLGKMINTTHCERSPYLHADMKTLYFSSDGRGGLGIRDVFKTTRLDDTWLNWSEPQNVGKEINTAGDDWGYVVSSSNVLGYFSADGNIKYITPLPKKAKATDVAVVKGKLTDSKGKRVTEGKVIVRDMETNVIYMECNVDPDSGSYQMALPPGGRYSLEIVQKNSLPQFDTIDTRQVTHFTERVVETHKIVNFKEMKEQNIAVQLNNLFFNSKEAIIRTDSYLELNNLAKLIKDNNWQIEILGHTDNVGSAETNKKLSEARAIAVKTYLVEKGCTAAAIKTIGFGASKPIADNKEEFGRAKNRRVEIKIK